MRSLLVVGAASTVVLGLVGCAKTADSEFGEILFDDTGQAIYLFDKEVTTTLECYDECADELPPVLAEGTR